MKNLIFILLIAQNIYLNEISTNNIIDSKEQYSSQIDSNRILSEPNFTFNNGIWTVKNYVDDFGDPTENKYITNKAYIKGSFSNTATQNSKLNVKFYISSSEYVAFNLYEYAGRNPVKTNGFVNYRVLIKDNDGKRYDLRAASYKGANIDFKKDVSKKIHNIFMKGGKIQFKIENLDNLNSVYEFTIQNANGYDVAFQKL